MNQFQSNAADTASDTVDAFTTGYILAAYWTSTGDNEQPSSEAELSPQGMAVAVEDCTAFQNANAELLRQAYDRLGYDEGRAGHDFWLTRNGHGTGFWDRDELEENGLGNSLAEAAKLAGTSDLYIGDDGTLYFE